MAGEIFREAMVVLGPLLPETTADAGQSAVLICTVRGDIHDLGKNIVIMMLRSYGIVVHDLGVDVSPDEVVRKAIEVTRTSSASPAFSRRRRRHEGDGRRGARRRNQIGRALPIIIGGGIVERADVHLDRRRPVGQ